MTDLAETFTHDADVRAALGLLTPDEAEEIIGASPPADYGVLLRGVRAVNALQYTVLRGYGLRNAAIARKAAAQALIMLLQIVNYAYALGIRHGRAH